MSRRLWLLVAVCLFATLAVGAGAFTSVDSARGVQVAAVQDHSAYLGVEQIDAVSDDRSVPAPGSASDRDGVIAGRGAALPGAPSSNGATGSDEGMTDSDTGGVTNDAESAASEAVSGTSGSSESSQGPTASANDETVFDLTNRFGSSLQSLSVEVVSVESGVEPRYLEATVTDGQVPVGESTTVVLSCAPDTEGSVTETDSTDVTVRVTVTTGDGTTAEVVRSTENDRIDLIACP